MLGSKGANNIDVRDLCLLHQIGLFHGILTTGYMIRRDMIRWMGHRTLSVNKQCTKVKVAISVRFPT